MAMTMLTTMTMTRKKKRRRKKRKAFFGCPVLSISHCAKHLMAWVENRWILFSAPILSVEVNLT